MKKVNEIKVLGAGFCCIDVIKCNSQKDLYMLGGTAANVLSVLSLMGMKAAFLQPEYLLKNGEWINNELEKKGIDLLIFNKVKLNAPRLIELLDNKKHVFLSKCPVCGKKLNSIKLPTKADVKKISKETSDYNLFYYDRISEGIKYIVDNNCGWNFYEPNSIRTYNTFFNNAKAADIIKVSTERIPSSYIERLLEDLDNVKTQNHVIIATMGGEGIKYIYKTNNQICEWEYVSIQKKTDFIDSSGAGDWLTASFLYYFLKKYPYKQEHIENRDINDFLKKAHEIAEHACYYYGAQGVLESISGLNFINRSLGTQIRVTKSCSLQNIGCDFCKI